MTGDQAKLVNTMSLNIQAEFDAEMIVALCASLLEVELSTLRAWLARLGDHSG